MFARSNFHDGLVGGDTFEKRKSLDAQCNSLSAAEKSAYKAIAESENEEEKEHDNDNFVEFLSRQQRLGEGGKKRKSVKYRNARLRAVQRTIQDMLSHSVFDTGTALHHSIRESSRT